MQATIPFIPWILSWEWDFLTPIISPYGSEEPIFWVNSHLGPQGMTASAAWTLGPIDWRKFVTWFWGCQIGPRKDFFYWSKEGSFKLQVLCFFHIKKSWPKKSWVTFRKLQQTRPPQIIVPIQFNQNIWVFINWSPLYREGFYLGSVVVVTQLFRPKTAEDGLPGIVSG